MRILSALYGVAAAVVFFFPSRATTFLNALSSITPGLTAMPEGDPALWGVLSSGLFLLLAALSLLSAQSSAPRAFVGLHLFSKALTFACLLYLFMSGQKYFSYLLALVIDGALILTLGWALLRLSIAQSSPAGAPSNTSSNPTGHPPGTGTP